MRTIVATALACLAFSAAAWADDPKPNDETLGMKPPTGAVVLFDDGDLDGWVQQGNPEEAAEWPVRGAMFLVSGGRGNIRTKETFGDCTIHLEFACPYEPDDKGQARGNSGVYLSGLYELQVLDSYGLDPQTNDCGAIYQQHKPAVNACKPPLQWQTYDITFRKAKVEDGKVTAKARLTVLQNGLKILDDVEIEPTPGNVPGFKAGDDGPLMLQDHGDAVQYRNIWLIPAKD